MTSEAPPAAIEKAGTGTAGTAAEILRAVSLIDADLDERRAALSKGHEAAESAAEARDAAERALAAAEEALRAAQVRVREAEKDVAHHEERRLKEEKRMDNVRTPKEQKAVEKELGMIGAKKEKAEARALEAIGAVEAGEKVVAERRAALEAARAAAEMARAEADARRASLEADVAGLEERRAAALAGLPPSLRGHYEHLRRRGLVAFAEVEDGACGGCRRSLTANLVAQARAGKAPRCPGCARILLAPS